MKTFFLLDENITFELIQFNLDDSNTENLTTYMRDVMDKFGNEFNIKRLIIVNNEGFDIYPWLTQITRHAISSRNGMSSVIYYKWKITWINENE